MSVVSLLVYMNTCAILIIVSGNIELNPARANKECPQCEKYVDNSSNTSIPSVYCNNIVMTIKYISSSFICVVVRVLHFSAFLHSVSFSLAMHCSTCQQVSPFSVLIHLA